MKKFFIKLKYWLFVRHKACYKACPFCPYYELCSKDFNDI